MQIDFICTLKGHRPLCQDDNTLLTIKSCRIHLLSFETLDIREIVRLPQSILVRLIAISRLARRVLRMDTYCSIQIDDYHFLISNKGAIYNIDISKQKVILEKRNLPGIKPLSFCRISNIPGFDELTCYGEYVKNSIKQSIKIMGRDLTGEWKCLHVFSAGEVGHVHSLAPDPYRNCVWIFTGDYGDAAAIWRATDNFKHVRCILRGKQQYRTSLGYPVPEGIIYATDSHLERNSIRLLRLTNNSAVDEKLYNLSGSCIYSMKLGNKYIFSTSVEPGQPSGRIFCDLIDTKLGPGILSNECDVIAGNPEDGFELALKWKADKWPKRLFQFSSIIFPMSTSSNNYLPVYGQACMGHDDRTELYIIH